MNFLPSNFIYRLKELCKRKIISFNYSMALFRLRRKSKGRPIKVGFWVSEVSKWKGQTLYELLERDIKYIPEVLIVPMRVELNDSSEELVSAMTTKLDYFKSHNMRARIAWNYAEKSCVSSKDIGCGIYFYQQPWDVPPAPSPYSASKCALTFYFPYYMVSYFVPDIEVRMGLHKEVFRYIVFNEELAQVYNARIVPWRYSGKIIGLGHPILDRYYLEKDVRHENKYVIYAPHFSMPYQNRLLTYSTFLDNGEYILEFAEAHPEEKWVFKPHPRLRRELTDCGFWSKEKVDNYYARWEKLGAGCYTADYLDYFMNAKVLITDCGSFLTEFACSEKPIIHLIRPEGTYPPNPSLEKLYSTFYKIADLRELQEYLTSIILNNEDPNKDARIKALNEAHLTDTYAAENILNYLNKLLKR